MESHIKWGLGFLLLGITLEITILSLFIIDTMLIVVGILLLIFGGREKRIEEVKD